MTRAQTYGAQGGPYQGRAREIYKELRENVIGNVFKACLGLIGLALC